MSNDIHNYYTPKNDEVNSKKIDKAGPKLTLGDVNRLKKIKATKNLENVKRSQTIQKIYGKPEENQ
jgi:hypothetical protein